ncbi:MAG: agmatinase [Phycisphaerae bacterium]|nr:agmatinase [Phycisphaerae bacterium]
MATADGPVFFPDAPGDAGHSRIVVIPVPYDGTSTWAKGADQGPKAILLASEHLEGWDIETGVEVYREGIFTDSPVAGATRPEDLVEAVRARVGTWLDRGRFPVVLGGDHSVTIGAVAAQVERFPDLTVLQLDAHSDLRETYKGSPYNHACVMARVRERCHAVQVGVRSMDREERDRYGTQDLFFADAICRSPGWMDEVVRGLGPRVYVTVDLDVFDSAVMPATGTPEPGGLGWYDVVTLLRAVCRSSQVTGFDVVELCPRPALHACDFLAAKLVYKLLSYRFAEDRHP